MKRILRHGIIAILGCSTLISCSSEKRTQIEYYQSSYSFVEHEDWATIQHSNTFIENNVYGKDYLRNNHQIVFSDSNASEFGWSWDYKYTSKRISSTPHIVFGKKVWHNHSTIKELPSRIDSIAELYYNFSYQLKATGNLEQAIVLNFTNNIESGPQHVILQLNIILESVGVEEIGEYVGTKNIGRHSFDEYHIQFENNHHKSIILKLKNSEHDFHFNFKPYFEYLIKNNHIESLNYLSVIEMGTFIKWGTGESVFNDFNCSVKLK